MPTNPNIILQAGRGIPKIRLNANRNALAENRIRNDQAQRNSLRDQAGMREQQYQLNEQKIAAGERTAAKELSATEKQDAWNEIHTADTPEKWGEVMTEKSARLGLNIKDLPTFDKRDALLAQFNRGMQTGSQRIATDVASAAAKQKQSNFQATFDAGRSDASATATHRAAMLADKNNPGPAKLIEIAGMRKEFMKNSGVFIKVRDAYGKIQTAAANPTAAGDMALIFNFMKMLDPGSTVREGEFASAEQAAGIPTRIVTAYNKALSGEKLGDVQRKDFLNQSKKIYAVQSKSHAMMSKQFTDLAKRNKINPADVVFDLSSIQEQQEQAVIDAPLNAEEQERLRKWEDLEARESQAGQPR